MGGVEGGGKGVELKMQLLQINVANWTEEA